MNLNRRHFISLLGATAAGLALENYAFAQTPLDPQLISQADPQPIGTAVLPDLPYKLDDLEPYIDAKTMEFHHGKHHAAYVRNLNAALDKYPQLKTKSIENLLRNLDRIPSDIRRAVRNNGGGHVNHSMFWKIMKPNPAGEPNEPTGAIAEAINNSFGDFGAFTRAFNGAGGGRFGSGWVMVILDGDDDDDNRKLKIITTPNQDTPLMEGKYPIMGNDVWEHAYYLKYQNRRSEYLTKWWNLVNWEEINKRYAQAIALSDDDD